MQEQTLRIVLLFMGFYTSLGFLDSKALEVSTCGPWIHLDDRRWRPAGTVTFHASHADQPMIFELLERRVEVGSGGDGLFLFDGLP